MSYLTISDGDGDILIHEVNSDHGEVGATNEHFVIYILPGNPGLISFYEPFAASLAALLKRSSTCQNATVTICGRSLRGFETSAGAGIAESNGGLSLSDTVLCSQDDLGAILETLPGTGRAGIKPKVILLGHSVGAYISLELLRRQGERRKTGSNENVEIVGGILVFPTVTWIAKSPMGRILTPILSIPFFPSVVGMLAFCLSSILPTILLYYIVRLVTWFPPQAASTLVRFLKSKTGVKQALSIGLDEMRTITEDKWTDDVWGSGLSNDPMLFMYLGSNDLYVPNSARDDLILTRGTVPGSHRPRALIDDLGIPHGWCIKHGDPIASKVAPWVEEVISTTSSRSESLPR
ncbi:hypothetical protein QBC39DRAFT_31566 [Podospora conica]|nr:hypothetical protein QBC39DRAFT_31566 [Schizothecium conicum]